MDGNVFVHNYKTLITQKRFLEEFSDIHMKILAIFIIWKTAGHFGKYLDTLKSLQTALIVSTLSV